MSAKDILVENLPDYFKSVAEFKQIMKAHGFALDKLEGMMLRVNNNHHIQTADGNTLSYYESLLGIAASPGDTLDYRRARVLGMIARDAPFSIGFLNEQLTRLYGADGYELEIDNKTCQLKITITTDVYGAVQLFYDFIWDVIPAHILMKVSHVIANHIDGAVYCGGVIGVAERVDL